jgi:hypothetical protein
LPQKRLSNYKNFLPTRIANVNQQMINTGRLYLPPFGLTFVLSAGAMRDMFIEPQAGQQPPGNLLPLNVQSPHE